MLDVDTLATHLDDHLADATAALELVERLQPDPRDAFDLALLYREIDEDRQVLETLRDELRSNGPAKGLKLADDAALGHVEALQLLDLGILGKRAMWRALATLRDDDPRLARWRSTCSMRARTTSSHAANADDLRRRSAPSPLMPLAES